MARCGFVGLGVMGYPMAGHLARAGHDVVVYNRSSQRSVDWCGEYDGRAAPTPAGVAQGAEFVFMCVGDDPDVLSVVAGPEGVLEAMEGGSVLVDHTTASAQLARDVHRRAASRGVGFVDAPISGGQAGAETGTLTVMCGGNRTDFERIVPVADAYSQVCNLIGGPGSGQLAKMVNQICIAGLIQALAEGLNFADCAGLDIEAVVNAISRGAAGSWQMENRARSMTRDQFHFGFALDWMRKDLRICIEEARTNGASLPVTELVDSFYAELQADGHGRWDTSALISRLRVHGQGL